MTLPIEWPATLRAHVEHHFGQTTAIEPLGGMSGGEVARLCFARASAIVKRSRSPVETHVYTTLSTTLEGHGISLPRLRWSGQDGDDFWLVMEDIPNPLPRERWEADAEALGMLRRLHALPLDRSWMPPGAFVPSWLEGLTEAALDLFPERERAGLEPLLERARRDALPLFEPSCPISGDPNPLNWGLRDDGSLVLYDWERFTLGTAPLDLAITVPGLGDEAAYERVAAVYLDGADRGAVEELAGSIRLAKMWSVVEFLAGVSSGAVEPSFPVGDFVEQASGWLRRGLFQ